MALYRSSYKHPISREKPAADLRDRVIRVARGEMDLADLNEDQEVNDALRSIIERLSASEERRQGQRQETLRLIQTDDIGASCFAMLRVDRLESLEWQRARPNIDDIILQVTETIVDCVRSVKIGRINHGVIEFVFAASNQEQANALLSSLYDKLEHPTFSLARSNALRFSLGAALAASDAGLVEIVTSAERALALAETMRPRFILWDEARRAEASAQLSLARDLRQALIRSELEVFYQPKLNLRTGLIDSAEALVRWTHPTKGSIPPDRFVKLAEETGTIDAMTRFVLRQTLADQTALREKGNIISMNVNFSGGLISDEEFCNWALDECRRSPGEINLEITETAVISDPDRALANANRLVSGGVGIAIDDYGSGLSSLIYLKQLPASELKIDKLFVLGLTSSHRDPLIVRSTIDLAHALEMEVTAEGVDDRSSLALLRAMGCDRAQGYYIARPMPIDALAEFLTTFADRDLGPPSRLLQVKLD